MVTFPTVRDRNVTTPNKVKLTDVEGEPGVKLVTPVPGIVNEEGTPLNAELFRQIHAYIDDGLAGKATKARIENGVLYL